MIFGKGMRTIDSADVKIFCKVQQESNYSKFYVMVRIERCMILSVLSLAKYNLIKTYKFAWTQKDWSTSLVKCF